MSCQSSNIYPGILLFVYNKRYSFFHYSDFDDGENQTQGSIDRLDKGSTSTLLSQPKMS